MTKKENYLIAFNNGTPEWVPNSLTDSRMLGAQMETFEHGPVEGGYDSWGVRWIPTRSTGGQTCPAANEFVLTEMEGWKSKIKFPDLTAHDWETMAKVQLDGYNPDDQVLTYTVFDGPFMRLTALMGFENALISLVSEPEACNEFFEKWTDFQIDKLAYIKKYFNPDIYCVADDISHERGLFMSRPTYKNVLLPHHKRLVEAAKSYGFLAERHCCGKWQDAVEDFIAEGYQSVSAVQPQNDIVTILKKYGKVLSINGGYDSNGRPGTPGVSPEEMRAEVRRAMDAYAPYGSFIFCGFLLTDTFDLSKMFGNMMPIIEEAAIYGGQFYKK